MFPGTWFFAATVLTSVAAVEYGPSFNAVALQDAIHRAVALGAPSVTIPTGDYYFGNVSLVIHRAANFALRAEEGPGKVQLWFAIGTGILVNQSRDVILDGLSVDYDPPAHYQGTVVRVVDDGGRSGVIQALVKTDPGFFDPLVFAARYAEGVPGVQMAQVAMLWNASDPGFGSYANVAWPPIAASDGHYLFNVSRDAPCQDIDMVTTDGTSCLDGVEHELQLEDKITSHTRAGFTLHILNSTRVHTRNAAIHGAPGFAISEYDGHGDHSYFNVSLGRRHVRHSTNGSYDTHAMCGVSNPTGGRLCLGMIASNNDALHSSGCKHGPSFISGELSYCLDDWLNVHSRVQVVLRREDSRHLIMIDPRIADAASAPDNFPYGNTETLTNAKAGDAVSFFLSGNLSRLGGARVLGARRATWEEDAGIIEEAQQLLDARSSTTGWNPGLTTALDAGPRCREFGCEPRVWRVAFDSDLPDWGAAAGDTGIVASLDGWSASGAVVRHSHLHHGRYGIRWKSSDSVLADNRISARYVELSPLEYYMEGPFRLSNVTVSDNVFSNCAAPPVSYPDEALCANDTHLPEGHWVAWSMWGGGAGGVCKAASNSSRLVPEACAGVAIERNVVRRSSSDELMV